MLACEIESLFPQEFELARRKYNRDLGDLLGLFGCGEAVKKIGHMKKVRFFSIRANVYGGETHKKVCAGDRFRFRFRPFDSVGKVEGVR